MSMSKESDSFDMAQHIFSFPCSFSLNIQLINFFNSLDVVKLISRQQPEISNHT